MKQVITNHKAAVALKKQQIALRKKEESAAAQKAKLDAFLGESKSEETISKKFIIVKENNKYVVKYLPKNSKQAVGSKRYNDRGVAQKEADKLNNKKNVNETFTFKEDSGGGRSTYVLQLEEDSWEKVKHLFDDKGRPIDNDIKNLKYGGYKWSLYAQPIQSMNGNISVKIYGVSGDYTFGNAPTYYQQKLRGNKTPAKEIFTNFIDKYL